MPVITRSRTFLDKQLARCEDELRSAIAARRAAKAALAKHAVQENESLLEDLRVAQVTLAHCNAREALLAKRGIYDKTTVENTYRAMQAVAAAEIALGTPQDVSAGPACAHCQKPFLPTQHTQKYCCSACKNRAAVARFRANKKVKTHEDSPRTE